MYCIKCGSKIKVGEKFCNNCGNPNVKRVLNIKIIFLMLGLIFVVLGVYFGFSKYQNNKTKHSIYFVDIKIQESSIACSEMIVEISDVWNKTIEDSIKYSKHELPYNPTEEETMDYIISLNYQEVSPADAISELMEKKWSISDRLKKRENEKNEIKSIVNSLNKIKNREVYEIVTEYFLVYERIYSAATNPVGSLLEYNNEVAKSFADLKEIQIRLEMKLSGM